MTRAMKLRDHPGMNYRGISNWPPVWTQARKQSIKTLKGEIGILRYLYANNALSGKCYLVIDYEQEQYVGCLIFNDRSFSSQICDILRNHIGRSIQEIGDLDISQTL
jgi:hypothetical protein